MATHKIGYFILDLGIIDVFVNTLLTVLCCSLGILLGIGVGVSLNLETRNNMELLTARVSDFELSMVSTTTQVSVKIVDLWTHKYLSSLVGNVEGLNRDFSHLNEQWNAQVSKKIEYESALEVPNRRIDKSLSDLYMHYRLH